MREREGGKPFPQPATLKPSSHSTSNIAPWVSQVFSVSHLRPRTISRRICSVPIPLNSSTYLQIHFPLQLSPSPFIRFALFPSPYFFPCTPNPKFPTPPPHPLSLSLSLPVSESTINRYVLSPPPPPSPLPRLPLLPLHTLLDLSLPTAARDG